MIIMKYNVYISAKSNTYDFFLFNNNLPSHIKGELRKSEEFEYNSIRGGVVRTGRPNYIWRSIQANIDYDDPEGSLHSLLTMHEDALKELVEIEAVYLLMVHFSVTYEEWEEVRGFIFQPETLYLIAKYGAEFYIDNYCNFGEPLDPDTE